jgi:thiamine biosynthesis lipoprotein
MNAQASASRQFRAMNTDVEIIGVGVNQEEVASATREAEHKAATWERMFSRFRPDSTLSAVNAAMGQEIAVEPAFAEVLDRARRAVAETDGIFDPTIVSDLEALGYDRTFDQIDPASCLPNRARRRPGAGWSSAVIDRDRGRVRLPAGMRLDFGGIAKGAFVDRIARQLSAWPGGCVNAGGDMVIWGEAPDGGSWQVGIEDPASPGRALMSLAIEPGAGVGVATSGTNRRQWVVGTERRHHLIDPATGRPVQTWLASVSVLAASATDAEISAKSLLIGSARNGKPRLVHGELAVLVDQESGVWTWEKGDDHACMAFAQANG